MVNNDTIIDFFVTDMRSEELTMAEIISSLDIIMKIEREKNV